MTKTERKLLATIVGQDPAPKSVEAVVSVTCSRTAVAELLALNFPEAAKRIAEAPAFPGSWLVDYGRDGVTLSGIPSSTESWLHVEQWPTRIVPLRSRSRLASRMAACMRRRTTDPNWQDGFILAYLALVPPLRSKVAEVAQGFKKQFNENPAVLYVETSSGAGYRLSSDTRVEMSRLLVQNGYPEAGDLLLSPLPFHGVWLVQTTLAAVTLSAVPLGDTEWLVCHQWPALEEERDLDSKAQILCGDHTNLDRWAMRKAISNVAATDLRSWSP